MEDYKSIWDESTFDQVERVKIHSTKGQKIKKGSYPVILFSHGWQSSRFQYTALLEDLASEGYIVVGIDHPYMGQIAMSDHTVTKSTEDHFMDPMKMVDYYASDQLFVLNWLKEEAKKVKLFKHCNFNAIGTMGHSNGFIPSLGAAQRDKDIQACLVLDKFENELAFLFEIGKPLGLLRTGTAEVPNKDFINKYKANLYDISVADSGHLSASDWDFIKAKSNSEKEKAANNLDVIRALVSGFFDVNLKAQPEIKDKNWLTEKRVEFHFYPKDKK